MPTERDYPGKKPEQIPGQQGRPGQPGQQPAQPEKKEERRDMPGKERQEGQVGGTDKQGEGEGQTPKVIPEE